MTKDINFRILEEKIFKFACEVAKSVMVNILNAVDERIMSERNMERYRLKDQVKTSIKTIFGDVEYSRRYYYDRKESFANCAVFIYNKKIGIACGVSP